MLGPDPDVVGGAGAEADEGGVKLGALDEGGHGPEGTVEVGALGHLEGEGGQREGGIGLEAGGKGNPAVRPDGGERRLEGGHEVDDVVGVEGVLDAVPVEILDLVEQVDEEGFFKGCVALVGHPDADAERDGLVL